MVIKELVDLREETFAVRLQFEHPLRLSAETEGILLDLDKYQKPGGKVQAAQVEANSKDPLVFPSDHLQAPPHLPPPHPFLRTIYLHTHNTLYLNSPHSNQYQYLGTQALWRNQSGVMNHLFKHLGEVMVVELTVLWDHMEVVQLVEVVQVVECPQQNFLMMVTNSTSHMDMGLILWFQHVLHSHLSQTDWTTDTPRVSTMTIPPLLSLDWVPTQLLPPWLIEQDKLVEHQSGAPSMSSFPHLEDPSHHSSSQFHLDEVLPTLP